MTITGRVTNQDTGAPVEGATIELRSGNVVLASIAAGNDGLFSINTSQNPDSIVISSVGFTAQKWPLPASIDKTSYPLPVYVSSLDTVTIKATKKSWPWLILIGIGLVAISDHKNKRYARTRTAAK